MAWPSPVFAPAAPVFHGRFPWVPLPAVPPCPDPDGLAKPPNLMGGHPFADYVGSSPFYGGHPYHHGGAHFSFPSLTSTANFWRTFNFPGRVPPTVPSVIHGGIYPSSICPSHPGDSPHAPALVASKLASAAPPLRPLMHEELSSSSASELLMSFGHSSVAAAPEVGPPVPPPALYPPVSLPVGGTFPPTMAIVPVADPAPPAAAPAPASLIHPSEPFKLPPNADSKGYLNLTSIINYYLPYPKFSTQRSDDLLITDSRNTEASCFWEGQICVAVQEGLLQFLFKNKGSLYNGKGFEMLAALNQHCRPDSVANAFTTLLSLFNDGMGETEEICLGTAARSGKATLH